MVKQGKRIKVDFGFKPYELQQIILDHMDAKILNAVGEPYRFFVVALGRQSGKSWLAKFALLDRAINRNQRCMWVAPSIPTARGHWRDLVKMLEDSGLPIKRMSEAAKEIEFYGGGSISVRSALEPDNLRGATLDFLVLDEAAFFRNGEYVWYQICLPMVTASRGVVLFLSTPNGRNWFYDLFKLGLEADNKYYKSWNLPSSASPYQDKELLKELKRTMHPARWREEFEAEFLADGGGVFNGIEAASNVQLMNGPLVGHRYAAGIDFGNNNDATTFTVIDMDERRQVFGKRMLDTGTIETVRSLIALLNLWQPEVTHIEKNGVGEALLRLMKEVLSGNSDVDIARFDTKDPQVEVDEGEDPARHNRNFVVGGHKIIAVHMNNALKRELVERLAVDIEYDRLHILDEGTAYGSIQKNEMSTFERQRTASGLEVTYGSKEGYHDDTVSALYIAYKGVPKPPKFKKTWEQKKTDKKSRNPFKGGGKHLTNKRSMNNAKRTKVRSAHRPR